MSYNIHHANPPSKVELIDMDAIARVIKKQNPDIVALQEIDVHTIRSGKINQAKELLKRTGLKAVYFAKSIDHDGGEYGVVILSKYPLSEMETHRLPTVKETKGEPRVLALATVKLPNGKKIRFGSTHLDALRTDTNRLLQIREVNRIAKRQSLPMIVAGDLNSEQNSPVIRILDTEFTRTCMRCKPTIPVKNPEKTIDFIAFRPRNMFRIVQHEVIPETYASDHLPVIAVLKCFSK